MGSWMSARQGFLDSSWGTLLFPPSHSHFPCSTHFPQHHHLHALLLGVYRVCHRISLCHIATFSSNPKNSRKQLELDVIYVPINSRVDFSAAGRFIRRRLVHREKRFNSFYEMGTSNIFLIESIRFLFTTMKIFIWIQWNVILNRDDKILSIYFIQINI